MKSDNVRRRSQSACATFFNDAAYRYGRQATLSASLFELKKIIYFMRQWDYVQSTDTQRRVPWGPQRIRCVTTLGGIYALSS